MRILAIHNYYQQRGGEDQCFEDEVNVLTEHGHEVKTYTVHNDSIQGSKLRVAAGSIWSPNAYQEVFAQVTEYKPDIVHVMNAFPLLSPSVFYAAKKAGAAIVHEVSNYRMFCPGTFLMRDGKHCEACIGKRFALPAIVHRCYRQSYVASLTLAMSTYLHRKWKTWDRAVDLFICPSSAARDLLIQGGLPENRLMVKPNALHADPGAGSGSVGGFVYVGRLSPEKGLRTLLEVWRLDPALPSLTIIGSGPDAELIRKASETDSRIVLLGKMPLEKLLAVVGEAHALIMPSVWNETFGRTTVEAFAKGTPVVGSRIGGTAELIDEGRTGWLFEPGSAVDLHAKLKQALVQSPEDRVAMRFAARQQFLENFLPENNYRSLVRCYERAMEFSRTSKSSKT